MYENVLSVIISVNDGSGSFEISVGASLISRLILFLCCDSTHFYDVVHSSLSKVTTEGDTGTCTSALIRELTVSLPENPYKVDEMTRIGVDSLSKEELDSCASSERIKSFTRTMDLVIIFWILNEIGQDLLVAKLRQGKSTITNPALNGNA